MNEQIFSGMPVLDKKPPVREEQVLRNEDNVIKLYLRLQNVYARRPNLPDFKGVMADTKYADIYSPQSIAEDEAYIVRTRKRIEETNSSKGQQKLDELDNNFIFGEAGQAMMADLLNTWLPDFQTIMTADFDDLKVGIDLVAKHKDGGYFGTAFDTAVSSKEDYIIKKLTRNWDENIAKGSLPVVKYFIDSDTKEKGRILVPKFIIGASATDVNEMAKAYLTGTEAKLDAHPFRKLFLDQVDVQVDSVLDFYEASQDDERFKFAYRQHLRVKQMVSDARQELSESKIIDPLAYHEYAKESLALKAMHEFANSKK